MKIEYNLSDSFIKVYNKASGIFLQKEELLKNENTKLHSYFSLLFKDILNIIIVFAMLLGIFYILELKFVKVILYICLGIILLWIAFGVILFIVYYTRTNKSQSGIIEFTEKNIIDTNANGFSYTFNYDDIELVVITNELIVFIINKPMIIIITNTSKDKVVNYITKRCSPKIIDRTTN